MEVQSMSLDIISTLPSKIIEKILCLLPIKEVVRTSILSRKWRYKWADIPTLVFDDRVFEKSANSNKQLMKYKLLHAINQVLLLHHGPILEFSLSIAERETFYEIDQIILHLSRINTVKIFTLDNLLGNPYKFPSSFFSLWQLTELNLKGCAFQPPLTFNGFNNLTSVYFFSVKITTDMLQHFLSNCPRLKYLVLITYDKGYAGINKYKFCKLFECLPLIEVLIISKYYIKNSGVGGVPPKLPFSLVHLKFLSFDNFCFMEQDEVSSALCLIRSSPNLETIKIQMHENQELPVAQTLMDLHQRQDCLDLCLNRLKELEMKYFQNLPPEMEFVKLIMSKSPKLQKVRIQLHDNVTVDEERKMLRDLVRLPFPCASPTAEFIVE